MDLMAAEQMIRTFIRDTTGAEDTGLNEQGMQTVELIDWALEICFAWIDAEGRPLNANSDLQGEDQNGKLVCFSRIYTFRKPPKPALWEEIRRQEVAVDTGGGQVEYISDLQGLYLVRSYLAPVAPQRLKQELMALMMASVEWLDVLEECLERVRRAEG